MRVSSDSIDERQSTTSSLHHGAHFDTGRVPLWLAEGTSCTPSASPVVVRRGGEVWHTMVLVCMQMTTLFCHSRKALAYQYFHYLSLTVRVSRGAVPPVAHMRWRTWRTRWGLGAVAVKAADYRRYCSSVGMQRPARERSSGAGMHVAHAQPSGLGKLGVALRDRNVRDEALLVGIEVGARCVRGQLGTDLVGGFGQWVGWRVWAAGGRWWRRFG